MKASTDKNQIFTDPVCGMKVNINKTNLSITYHESRYYFCADACREAFEKNPENYLTGKPVKRKGLWGRYLDRLQKSTGGKPMQCH